MRPSTGFARCVAVLTLCSHLSILAQDTKTTQSSPQVTKPMFHQALDWSPDGEYLSFSAMTDYDPKTDSYRSHLYVVKADGSNMQRVSGGEGNAHYSSWSKDGERIVFSVDSKDRKASDIFTIKKDGTSLIQLTKNMRQNSTPDFSPDGKKIAFISSRDGAKAQIYVMDVDGGNLTPLTTDSSVGHYNPIWSSDGKRIVYYSVKGDRKDQVWVMNADGSNQTLLTGGIGHNIFPAFSPDGKNIIFSSSNRDGGNTSYVEGSYLYVMNADGSRLRRLPGIKSFFARFSPDGKKIAYISGEFPTTEIFIADADGRNQNILSRNRDN